MTETKKTLRTRIACVFITALSFFSIYNYADATTYNYILSGKVREYYNSIPANHSVYNEIAQQGDSFTGKISYEIDAPILSDIGNYFNFRRAGNFKYDIYLNGTTFNIGNICPLIISINGDGFNTESTFNSQITPSYYSLDRSFLGISGIEYTSINDNESTKLTSLNILYNATGLINLLFYEPQNASITMDLEITSITPSPVPEPSTFTLLSIAVFLGVCFIARTIPVKFIPTNK